VPESVCSETEKPKPSQSRSLILKSAASESIVYMPENMHTVGLVDFQRDPAMCSRRRPHFQIQNVETWIRKVMSVERIRKHFHVDKPLTR